MMSGGGGDTGDICVYLDAPARSLSADEDVRSSIGRYSAALRRRSRPRLRSARGPGSSAPLGSHTATRPGCPRPLVVQPERSRRVVTSPGYRSVGPAPDVACSDPHDETCSRLGLPVGRAALDWAMGSPRVCRRGRARGPRARGSRPTSGQASVGRAARGPASLTSRAAPCRASGCPRWRVEPATPADPCALARRRRRRHRGAQRRGEPRAQRVG